MTEIDKSGFTPPVEDKRTIEDSRISKALEFLQKIGAEVVFASEENIREFINEVDFKTFEKLLIYTNGLIRGIPRKNRTADGEDAVMGAEVPPRQEDKGSLFKETFLALKQMNQERRSLEDMAVLISSSINAIHYFRDANGRMSRLSYFLFSQPHPNLLEEPVLKTILIEDEGKGRIRQLIDVNTFSIGRSFNDYIFKNYLGLRKFDPMAPTMLTDSSPDYRVRVMEILAERGIKLGIDFDKIIAVRNMLITREGYRLGHGLMAIVKYLQSKGKLQNYLKVFRDKKTGEDEGSAVEIIDVLENISKDDIDQIINYYWEIKRLFVQTLIRSIEDPDKYKIDEGTEHEISMLDYLKETIGRRSKLAF